MTVLWSEKPGGDEVAAAVAAFQSVLPVPLSISRTTTLQLQTKVSAEQIAGLLQEEPNFVWLDGAVTRHLLFHDPIAVISSDARGVNVRGPRGAVTLPLASLDALDIALRAWSGTGARLAGWISYEVADELEDLAFQRSDAELLPRLQFGLYDSVLVGDVEGNWSFTASDAWREIGNPEDLLLRASRATPDSERGFNAELCSGDEAFLRRTTNIVERIHAGDLFQTNLCRHLSGLFPAHLAWRLYLQLRALNPAEFGAFIQAGNGRAILSNSPEMFLTLSEGQVQSRPIKGTRRRGRTAEDDSQLREELLLSEKDRAELAMVVDVTRNDLSRVCVAGSVTVTEHAALMTLPTLHHTCSKVSGTLRDGVSAADVLKAAFPPASITGAPKIAAMDAAFREERATRGPCMGSMGWMSLDGDMELSVAIRTAYTANGEITYLAGCGITAESVPEAELQESRAKASAFVAAMGL